jgi:tRNA pseudouridine38-40 synthase
MVARLLIEYDGSAFSGWARQPGLRTVQAEIERALAVLVPGDAVQLTVAGRTDAGVHAWGQVASYVGEPVAPRSLNALLPDDVAVLDCQAAPAGFDARRDATSRAYCYRVLSRPARSAVLRGRAWHVRGKLDSGRLQACAQALIGTHDFTAFTPTETYHVRFSRQVFAARWQGAAGPGSEGVLEFWIEGDTFMRRMNRALVGTMLQVGSGARTLEAFTTLLDGAPRAAAGPTAPACGLYLAGVGYGDARLLVSRGGETLSLRRA